MDNAKASKDRKRTPVMLACLVLIVAVTLAGTATAQQAPPKTETVTLNWSSFLPGSHPEMIAFNKGFVAKAVELSKGRLAFKFRGGPETIALMDLPKATQSGIVDFSIILAGVVESVAPGVGATILSRISVDEERKNGTYAYMDQLCNKGALHYMGRHSPANDLQFFNLFLNKKVEKPEDFKKLRIGTATAARALTEGWGAAAVNLQLTDYYTAMERNTVDGVSSSTASNWVSSGCQAVTKFMPLPGYLQSSPMIVMNLNVWNKLPKELQQAVTDAMIFSEKTSGQAWTEDKVKALQKIKEAKVEVYNLSPDTAKWLVDTAYESTWAYQQKRFPDVTPRLKVLLSGGK
ncbi:MAG TPA: TRAP transporter substrate-binding protein DctP [Syntrophorhabdales bacterium]|nr:TRAP transporter substrate-binding protein DctP [Syntrophorhabdales bacterium]